MIDPGVDARASAGAGDPASNGRRGVFLHAGQIFVSTDPASITTILGSCVAVCLWDPMTRLGGTNHFLLPLRASGAEAAERFGNLATEQLIDRLLQLGARRRFLQAKVFGGACVLEAFRKRDSHLGHKNVEAALQVLADGRIPVVARDVGGQRGRKLVFQTDDGSAWVRLL